MTVGSVYRTSPEYEIVVLDRLSPELLESLRQASDGDLYGVLRRRSRSDAFPLRTVNRDTALLLFTLRRPGPIPSYARRGDPERLERQIRALVLDGVLQVREGDGFLAGPAAVRALRQTPSPGGGDLASNATTGRGSDGRIAHLSHRALGYAAALPTTDPARLGLRLYMHNQIPLSPRWAARLPDAAAVLSASGLDRGASHGWRHRPEKLEGWLTWVRQTPPEGRAAAHSGSIGDPTWKLYVSPRPEAVPDVMDVLPEIVLESGAVQFKIGSDAEGLLRSDKIVVHFGAFEQLAEAADALARELLDLPVQGVPFTSQIDGPGLLSWGVDPPIRPSREAGGAAPGPPEVRGADSGQKMAWRGPPPVSWRAWITGRLGMSLARAKRQGSGPDEAVAFALERLRTDGVDVEDWTPSSTLWLSR